MTFGGFIVLIIFLVVTIILLKAIYDHDDKKSPRKDSDSVGWFDFGDSDGGGGDGGD